MSVWHEPIPPVINHVLQSTDGAVRAVIRRRDHFGGVNTLSFMRWTGDGPALIPKSQPESWIVLRPREELTSTTLEAANEQARSLMEQVGGGQIDRQFEITPYQPQRLDRVQEMDHASGKLKSLILQHPDGKYEVRYFLHELLGVWQKSQTEEWDWVRTRWETATFATDLPAAEEAARQEMEQIISEQTRTSIRDWFAWVGEAEKRPRST